MPINEKQISGAVLYQREQYQKRGVSRWYWDYKDRVVMRKISEEDNTILDIGCGEGVLIEKLKTQYPQKIIIGVDIMAENVKIGLENSLPIRLGDVYHLDFPENSIDLVIFMEVIEHLASPTSAIGEINKVLKPGGKLIIVFPNDLSFLLARILVLRFKEAIYDPGHLKQWNHRAIRKFLEEHNFDAKTSISIPFKWWPISLHGVIVALKRKT